MRFFVLSWLFVSVLVGYSGMLRMTRLPMPALGIAITLGFLLTIAVSRYYRRRALSAGIRALVAATVVSTAGLVGLVMVYRGREYTVLPLSLVPTFLGPLSVVTPILILVWWWRWRKRRSRTNTEEHKKEK